jgi:hypothetical protein
MSNHRGVDLPIDHPDIVAIAIEVMLHPERRPCYSPIVLSLADAALEYIDAKLKYRREYSQELSPQQAIETFSDLTLRCRSFPKDSDNTEGTQKCGFPEKKNA